MKARGVVRITPADIGKRVTVRARIPHEEGEPSMTDTVGTLEAWDDDGLHVRRRNGTLVTIPSASVIAGRTIFAQAPPTARDLG